MTAGALAVVEPMKPVKPIQPSPLVAYSLVPPDYTDTAGLMHDV